MGGVAFTQTPKEELAFSVLTTFIEHSYYEERDNRVERMVALIKQVYKQDPLFIAKLAIVARKEFHMRSVFVLLVGELAKLHKGDSPKAVENNLQQLVKNLIVEGTERPDDLLEILSYLEKPYPNSVKKGIAKALDKFDEYQIAKYKNSDKELSMVDLINLVHPKSKKNSDIYSRLLQGNLKNDKTWEARLSGGESKEKVFFDLLQNNELGYMAALRNLRNMLKTGSKELIDKVCSLIDDKARVRSSKQLPFRYISAYRSISEGITFEQDKELIARVKAALDNALKYSIDNIPAFSGRTAILTDNSGSMRGDGGGKSILSRMSRSRTADIANLFAVLYWLKSDNTYVGVFGDKLLSPELDRTKDIFYNFEQIDKTGEVVGGGTETGIFTFMQEAIKNKTKVDRIIIFSDSQVGTGCSWYDEASHQGDDFNALYFSYRKSVNPEVIVYSVDLRGYGNKMFKDGVISVAGWSEKIFDLMNVVEKKDGMVKWIENYSVTL